MRRHELFVRLRSEYLIARLNQKPPVTKSEYDEDVRAQKSGKSPKITSEQWRAQAQSRKAWDSDAKAARYAAHSPYHFEESMYFASHVFDEPEIPPEETEDERKARLKAMDAAATSNLIEAFERFAAG